MWGTHAVFSFNVGAFFLYTLDLREDGMQVSFRVRVVLVVGQRRGLGDARSEAVVVVIEGLVVRLWVRRRGVGGARGDAFTSDGCVVILGSLGLEEEKGEKWP